MISTIITIFIFIPGIMLLHLLSKIRNLDLTFLEKVLYGSILWKYLLVVPSILIGSFSHLLKQYFLVFLLASIVIVIIFLFYESSQILKSCMSIKTLLPSISSEHILYGINLLSLMTIVIGLAYFHTIFKEWDAIAHYIPVAKAIVFSGGLHSNIFRLLDFIEHSPAVPVSWAWLLYWFSGLDSLYDLALMYFLLTLLALFLICERLFSREYALISILVFLSLPTVVIILGSRLLYLDIPFLMYLVSTLYCTLSLSISRQKESKRMYIDCIMLGCSACLMIYTRLEFGILLAPLLFSIAFFIFSKRWIPLLVLALGLGYYIKELRNIVLNIVPYSLSLLRLIPVFLISTLLIVMIIMKTIFFKEHQSICCNLPKGKIISLMFLSFSPTAPLWTYILKNIFIHGFIIPVLHVSNTKIVTSASFYKMLNPQDIPSVIEYFKWNHLMSWWLIPSYLPPLCIFIITSLLIFRKRKNIHEHTLFILFYFASIFIIWMNLYCDPQPRRLYYFAPFIALAATHGLLTIKRSFWKFALAPRIVLYNCIVVLYTLMKINVDDVNDLALNYHHFYAPEMSMEYTIILMLIFITLFTPYESLLMGSFIKLSNIKEYKKKRLVKLFSIVMVTTIFVINLHPMCSVVGNVFHKGYATRYEHHEGWLHYPDVVEYYINNINDSHVTLCFYCGDLITFSNRRVIDLSDWLYGMELYSVLAAANKSQLLSRIKDLDIKYFLLPKPPNTFYSFYKKMTNSSVLGEFLTDYNSQIQFLASFKYVDLYIFRENTS